MEKNFWSSRIKNIDPYIPGEQPDIKMIKLNTNENPYPPSPLISDWLKDFDPGCLSKYPDPDAKVLKEAISGYYGVASTNIFAGNGSDEILAFAFRAFFDEKTQVNFPDITYSFYPVYAGIFDVPYNIVPLNDDFEIVVKDYYERQGGVIIANPNAPTGIYLAVSEIRRLLENNLERIIIVDEAYIDFGGESCVPLTEEFENLLVIKTFSKSRSLAGLRAGYAIGNENLIKGLETVRDCINSYTTDFLAQNIAAKAMQDGEWFERCRNEIIGTRDSFIRSLDKMGFKTLPSEANFVFTTHEKIYAENLFELLKKKGILVRYFNKKRIDNYLRITIGTKEEMEKLSQTLKNILEGS